MNTFLTKCHVYLGLFFLVEIWLFSLTGLFLNHPQWRVNDYRQNSPWVDSVAPIVPVERGGPVQKAENYCRQWQLEGELLSVREQAEQGVFRFDVHRPGEVARVVVDLNQREARLSRRNTGGYGTLNGLHIFGKMKRFDPGKEGITWWATRVWVASMDGLALGFLCLVFTGLYLWLQTKKIVGGAISLLAGTLVGLFFLLL